MDYCTIEDIETQTSTPTLIQLTSDDGQEVVDRVVAQEAMREDILKDIRSALDKALSEGKTFREFQKELKPTLQKKGWWGEQIVVDTQGNAEKVQLGSMYRLKTIYAVNMQTSYMTGRYKTQMDNVDNRPYWEYVAMDQRVFLIKPDVCDLFLLGKPCSHKLSFLRPRLERGAFLREFSRLLTWGKWGFSNRNRPGEPFFVRAVPIA